MFMQYSTYSSVHGTKIDIIVQSSVYYIEIVKSFYIYKRTNKLIRSFHDFCFYLSINNIIKLYLLSFENRN